MRQDIASYVNPPFRLVVLDGNDRSDGVIKVNVPGFKRFPQPRLSFVQKMPREQFPGSLFARLMTNAEFAARRKEETSGLQRLSTALATSSFVATVGVVTTCLWSFSVWGEVDLKRIPGRPHADSAALAQDIRRNSLEALSFPRHLPEIPLVS